MSYKKIDVLLHCIVSALLLLIGPELLNPHATFQLLIAPNTSTFFFLCPSQSQLHDFPAPLDRDCLGDRANKESPWHLYLFDFLFAGAVGRSVGVGGSSQRCDTPP